MGMYDTISYSEVEDFHRRNLAFGKLLTECNIPHEVVDQRICMGFLIDGDYTEEQLRQLQNKLNKK